MGLTHFPRGVASFGIPVLGTGGPYVTTGNVYFVDSGSSGRSDAADHGTSPDTPFATIDYAVGRCTANNGDIIFVMPGHAETVSAAGGLALDVAGITIVGLGSGASRPTITLDTAATADVDVDAANVTIDNLIFSANFADIAVCLDVNAADCTIRNCRFQATATNMNFLVCIQTGTTTQSNNMVVENCYFLAVDAANTHAINIPATPDGVIIRNNIFIGDWGTMCIGGAGVCTYITVVDNVIYNAASTNDACINLAATATGIVMRNLCCGAAPQANGITAAACALAENYYGVISEDLSAILDPISTA